MLEIVGLAVIFWLAACGSTPIPGPKGDAGVAGATGGTGSTGSTAAISSGYTCSKISGGFNFHYNGIVYSTTDVWVECDVANATFQSTSTRVYKSTQVGATTFGCLITFDSDGTPTSGFWNFTANSTKKAIYTDSGSGLDQTTVTFASTDCTTF